MYICTCNQALMSLQSNMAKILMTAIVADIRNKLNGSVFSKNRYGAYVRTKVTPVNPKSTAQVAQRSSFAANAQAWRGLTDTQRASWAAAVPNFPISDVFANIKFLSPSALYSKLNGNLATINTTSITSAPNLVSVPLFPMSSITADISSSELIIQTSVGVVPANFVLVIRATGIIGAGQTFVKNKFRIINTFSAPSSPSGNNFSFWSSKFGAFQLGGKIYIEAYYVSTLSGQAGIPSQLTGIVVA